MNSLKRLREKLSDNELIFANHYLKCGNKLKAYELTFPDSKENESNPYGFYNRVSVKQYIKEFIRMESEKVSLSKEWVLAQLQENAQMAKDGVEAVTTTEKDGVEVSKTITKKPELANANKATELIGKELGMFTNEISINGVVELVQELQTKGDELAAVASSDDD